MDAVGQLAEFAAETPDAALPPAARARTALILADCIAAIVGGAAEPDIRALAARPGLAEGGPSHVLGTARWAQPQQAAFLNGTAGTVLEMDEGNQFAKGHPGIHTVPAALAFAGTQDVSGRVLITAIALGYEVGARVGIATALRPSMHPHGTWGTLCAAAAVQRLAGSDAARMREGLSIAASLGLTNSRRTMLEGGTVRNAFAGLSGQMGLLTHDLLAAGFTGDLDGVTQVYGHVVSDSFDAEALTAELGTRWEVSRNYFKMHSCCRYNHAALDALAMIRAQAPDLDPARISRIDVDSYALAVELDNPAPRNVLAGKFSVPFAVATTLVNGSSGVASFTAGNVANPEIRALAARVTIREDKAMTARLPDQRPAAVTLHMEDGRALSARTDSNRGDWADPYPVEEIEAKYLSLTTRLWPMDKACAVWDAVLDLDKAASVSDLLTLMATDPR